MPPKSTVRVASTLRRIAAWKVGTVFRVGYYGRRDGLDCVWLVNDDGEYQETVDHEFLFRYFDIIMVSDETDLYGRKRPKLPPIRKGGARRIPGSSL